MPRIEEQIDIASARADVFKFCHDIEQWPKWDEQVEYVELLSPRPVRQGTLLRIDAKQGGSVFTWDAEYVGYQFPSGSMMQVLDVAPTSPFGRGSELSWQFEPASNGTRLTWVWDYEPNGIIARIVDALGRRGVTRRAIKRSLDNLKKTIEAGGRAGWQA